MCSEQKRIRLASPRSLLRASFFLFPLYDSPPCRFQAASSRFETAWDEFCNAPWNSRHGQPDWAPILYQPFLCSPEVFLMWPQGMNSAMGQVTMMPTPRLIMPNASGSTISYCLASTSAFCRRQYCDQDSLCVRLSADTPSSRRSPSGPAQAEPSSPMGWPPPPNSWMVCVSSREFNIDCLLWQRHWCTETGLWFIWCHKKQDFCHRRKGILFSQCSSSGVLGWLSAFRDH